MAQTTASGISKDLRTKTEPVQGDIVELNIVVDGWVEINLMPNAALDLAQKLEKLARFADRKPEGCVVITAEDDPLRIRITAEWEKPKARG